MSRLPGKLPPALTKGRTGRALSPELPFGREGPKRAAAQ